MPSEFNHIDDFFRKKEEESSLENSVQERHWQQMRTLLVAPGQPVARIRTFRKLYWQAAAGIIVIAATALLLIYPKKHTNTTADSHFQKNQTTSTTRKKQDLVHPSINSIPSIVKTETKKKISTKVRSSITTTVSDVSKTDPVVAVPSNTTVADAKTVYQSFYTQLKKPAQNFIINTRKDTVIYCQEGTVISIPSGAFQTAIGLPVNTLIDLYVKEFYSFADIISNQLTTTSNGKPIETGGMLYLEAKSGTQVLQIRPGASLDIQMPARKFDPQMQLFMSNATESTVPQTNPGSLNPIIMDWIPMGQKQIFYDSKKKIITLLNLTNNPYEVVYRHENNPDKVKSIGKFRIPWYCKYTTEEIKKMLEEKFGHYYDQIKVKREWKPWSKKVRAADSTSVPDWSDSHYVGDTVSMLIRFATKWKYITKQDSLHYEEQWKKELEDAIKRNQSYSDLMEVRSKYNFQISNMGWINCDRFKNYPPSLLTDFVFTTPEQFHGVYFHSVLIFNNENVVMQGYLDKNKIVFPKIPKGKSVSIVCVGVKEGKVFTCVKNLDVNAGAKDLQFTETNPEEFKDKLRRFGTVASRG